MPICCRKPLRRRSLVCRPVAPDYQRRAGETHQSLDRERRLRIDPSTQIQSLPTALRSPREPEQTASRPQGETHAAGQWWDELSKWRPPGIFGPRSLRDLAMEDPEAPIVVALSLPPISRAIWNDLTNAAEVSEQVVVLGRSAPPGVTLIPCDARGSKRAVRRSTNFDE